MITSFPLICIIFYQDLFSCNKIFEISEHAGLSVKMPAPATFRDMNNSMVWTGGLKQDRTGACCKTGGGCPDTLSCSLADVWVTTFQPGCCTKVVPPFTQLEKRGRNLYIPCKDFAVILSLETILWKQGRIFVPALAPFSLSHVSSSVEGCAGTGGWKAAPNAELSIRSPVFNEGIRAFATELCKTDWEHPQFSQQPKIWWLQRTESPQNAPFSPSFLVCMEF